MTNETKQQESKYEVKEQSSYYSRSSGGGATGSFYQEGRLSREQRAECLFEHEYEGQY